MDRHRSHGSVVCRRLNALLITAFAISGSAALGAEVVLSDFNSQGFDYTFDDFSQSVGPGAVRITDPNNGWGGAGVVGNLDLGTLADGRLVIDLIPEAGNGIDRFSIELIDQISGSQTMRSGKWSFDVSSLTPGVPTTLVSQTPLSSPTSGIGDFNNLDLGQIKQWQVLGDFGSPDPFDLSFDRIAVSDELAAPPAYPGAEPDASWRDQAASRIDASRKANLAIEVRDASGATVPGATVDVAMQQHEFGFGSAVQAFRLRNNAAQHQQYKAQVAELFNLATLENNLKWVAWEGEFGGNFTQNGALSALDWLSGQGIDGRGHVMVWPGEANLPSDIRTMLADGNLTPTEQQQVRTRIANHIGEIATATNGKVVAWDVVNETRTNNDLMRELSEGNDALVTWFNLARQAATNADLYLNDFGILNSWGQAAENNRDQYYETIQTLKDDGAAIEGIGFQGHFRGDDITGPEELWAILDRFDELGLAMQVTEFDFETTDEELQAQYTRDFFTAMFAHEGIDDLILWGFWEDAHWRPDAALFRSDWSIKPNGEAFLDLVFDEWWTDEVATSDEAGTASIRGFKGDYEISARAGGAAASVELTLSADQTATIVLPYLVGDYNGDGRVDSADYSVWRDSFGSTTNLAADGNHDGVVDDNDYAVWASRFGNAVPSAAIVPEPTAMTTALVLAAVFGLAFRR